MHAAPRHTLPRWSVVALAAGLLLSAAPAMGRGGQWGGSHYAGNSNYTAGLRYAQSKGYLTGSFTSRGSVRQEHLAKLSGYRSQENQYKSKAGREFVRYRDTKDAVHLKKGQEYTRLKQDAKLKGLQSKRDYQKARAATAKDPKKAAQHRANAKEFGAKATQLKQQMKDYAQKNGLKPRVASNKKLTVKPRPDEASGENTNTNSGTAPKKPQLSQKPKLTVKPRPANGGGNTEEPSPSSDKPKPNKKPYVTIPGGGTLPVGDPEDTAVEPKPDNSPPEDADPPILPGGAPGSVPNPGDETQPPDQEELPPPQSLKEANNRARMQLAGHDFAGLVKTMEQSKSVPKTLTDRVLFRGTRMRHGITGSRWSSIPLLGRLFSKGNLTKTAEENARRGDPVVAGEAAGALRDIGNPGTTGKMRKVARQGLKGAREDAAAHRHEAAIERYLTARAIQQESGQGLRGKISAWWTRRKVVGGLKKDLKALAKEGNLGGFERALAAYGSLAEQEGKPLSAKDQAELEGLYTQAQVAAPNRLLEDAKNLLDGKIPADPQTIVEQAATRIVQAEQMAQGLKTQGITIKSGRGPFKSEAKFYNRVRELKDKLLTAQAQMAQGNTPRQGGIRGWLSRHFGRGRNQPPPLSELPQAAGPAPQAGGEQGGEADGSQGQAAPTPAMPAQQEQMMRMAGS